MCFSAPVSFAASGVVGAIGIATLAQVKDKKELPFALIPIFFALHQFMEGLVWVSAEGSMMHLVVSYIFIIIALSLWPFYMPLSVYLLENKTNKIRKKVLLIMTILGALVTISTFGIILSDKVSVSIACNSLSYNLGSPNIPYYKVFIQPLLQAMYSIMTIGSLIVIKNKIINFFGIGMLISFLVTYVFLYEVYFSVWCFFSALLSMIIFLYFRQRRKLDPK
jgi:Family of unknown function (DUF6629)